MQQQRGSTEAGGLENLKSEAHGVQAKIGSIVLAYIAFISLGLPDGLLGVAWPSIRANFALPLDALGSLLLAAMAGYLTASFLSGPLAARLGVGRLLASSCCLTGTGLLGYTLAPAWWIMVALGAVAGLGAGAIDAGINNYIAAHHGEGLMQWLHASFGLGVTLGPAIMTAGINVFGTWRWGYAVVGMAQLALAACFALTASRWRRDGSPVAPAESRPSADNPPILETLGRPGVRWSILMFFVYAGIELSLGYWAYTLLTESRGIAPAAAGIWAGGYWGLFTLGRLLAGLYAGRLGVGATLRLGLVAALFGALLLWWNPSSAVSLAGVAIVGFAIAPVFPGLVSGTGGRVGAPYVANTIGMQIGAAGLGGAVLPGVAGILARTVSLEVIPVYLVVLLVVLGGMHETAGRVRKTHGLRVGNGMN